MGNWDRFVVTVFVCIACVCAAEAAPPLSAQQAAAVRLGDDTRAAWRPNAIKLPTDCPCELLLPEADAAAFPAAAGDAPAGLRRCVLTAGGGQFDVHL